MGDWQRIVIPLAVASLSALIPGCGRSEMLEFTYIDVNGKAVPKYAPEWWGDVYEGITKNAADATLKKLAEVCAKDSMHPEVFSMLEFDWNNEVIHLSGAEGTYYFRKDGSLVTQTDCPFAEGFSEGLAPVCVGFDGFKDGIDRTRWGYIDGTGTFVIEPKFTGAAAFSDGLARVHEGGGDRPVKVYKQGETIRLEPDPERRAGYIDTAGAYVIPPDLFTGQPCSEGLCVCEDAEFQQVVFTTKGERVDGFRSFRLLGPFSEGLAPARDMTVDSNEGVYVDTTGKVVLRLTTEYDFIQEFHEGRAAVMRGDRWGFIDRTGKEVVPLKYRVVTPFHDGVAAVAR